jgi:hypothetical protein
MKARKEEMQPSVNQAFKAQWYIHVPPALTVLYITINSDHFLKQHLQINLSKGHGLSFLCGVDFILTCYLDQLDLERVKVRYCFTFLA